VTATTPLNFFVIGAQSFDFVLNADPAIERKLLAALVRRSLAASGEPA
jgi:CRP-like cAMP-binding protein